MFQEDADLRAEIQKLLPSLQFLDDVPIDQPNPSLPSSTHPVLKNTGKIQNEMSVSSTHDFNVVSYQLKLIKMRAKFANTNDCAVPFLSRAATNLCWYYISFIKCYKCLVYEFLITQ